MQNFFQEYREKGSTIISNLILLNLNELNMDADEYLVYSIMEMYNQKGVKFPIPSQIERYSGFDQKKVFSIIQNLLKKNIIDMKTVINDNHQQQDVYDLQPIFQKLNDILNQKAFKEDQEKTENSKNNLFKMIEIEFGRPLSPIEQETIHSWIDIDHYPIELIKLSLKEAVLNQAYSLKYMDRILINWEKQNIKTAQQLEDKKRRGEY